MGAQGNMTTDEPDDDQITCWCGATGTYDELFDNAVFLGGHAAEPATLIVTAVVISASVITTAKLSALGARIAR